MRGRAREKNATWDVGGPRVSYVQGVIVGVRSDPPHVALCMIRRARACRAEARRGRCAKPPFEVPSLSLLTSIT